MNIQRQFRYYYLRFVRLRGQPPELALGLAIGVFAGLLPIMPLQIVLAVSLAMICKCSKITAALGTWISNPFNFYFVYFIDYKVGAFLLRLPEPNGIMATIMEALRTGASPWHVLHLIVNGGSLLAAALVAGGLLLGITLAVPTYFTSRIFFTRLHLWRAARKARKESA